MIKTRYGSQRGKLVMCYVHRRRAAVCCGGVCVGDSNPARGNSSVGPGGLHSEAKAAQVLHKVSLLLGIAFSRLCITGLLAGMTNTCFKCWRNSTYAIVNLCNLLQ